MLSATVISTFYPLGEIVLGLLAMHLPSLRTLMLAMYVPGHIVAIYFWLMPESVRWLVASGHHERAMKALNLSAAANHTVLSDRARQIVARKCRKAAVASEKADSPRQQQPILKSSVGVIFRSGVIPMRLLLCSVCWAAVLHAYYGMSVSATRIEGDDNKYLSFIVVVCAEIPAVIIAYFLSSRMGRRITLCASMAAAGTAIIASGFVPPEQILITRFLFFGGMLSIAMALTILYIYTAEIWPTSIRNTLLNVCSMVGRFGSVAAPLTPLLVSFFAKTRQNVCPILIKLPLEN